MRGPITGRLRAAIIGCGRIAQRHAAILRDLPDVQLIAMVDTRLERAEQFARDYGGRGLGAVRGGGAPQAPWRGTWAMDGGVFSNQASHHVDMLVHMMGEVEEVSALTTTRLVSIEAEDTGIAMLRFRNGALGVIEATTAARPVDLEGSISILGQNGTVEVGGFAMNELKGWRFADPLPENEGVLELYRTNPPDVYGFGHHEYLNQAVRAIQTAAPAPIDGREGRKSLEVITAIYEASESGGRVAFPFNPRPSATRLVRGRDAQ